jgi:hypothetical protein
VVETAVDDFTVANAYTVAKAYTVANARKVASGNAVANVPDEIFNFFFKKIFRNSMGQKCPKHKGRHKDWLDDGI